MNHKVALCLDSLLALSPVSALLLTLAAAPVRAQSGVGHEGQWFTYGGAPTLLVGFDCQELAADPSIDYVAALDAFADNGINKVRVWTYVWFGTTSLGALTPWLRDGNGDHDLDQWNAAYWTRMHDFVAAARSRSIAVEVTVFAPYPGGTWWWASDSYRLAWNATYNQNGAFSTNASGHFDPEFFDLGYGETSTSGNTLADYQAALVDKVVAELGGYDNVYFEVCNEFGTYGLDVPSWYGWQVHWAERIRSATSQPVAVHAGGGNESYSASLYWSEPSIDVLNFRFDFGVSPQQLSDWLHDAQGRGKILTVNETHSYASAGAGATDFYGNLDAETQYAWGLLLSGAHVGFYEDDSSRIGSSGWLAGAARLGALRDIVERLRFWELSPVDGAGNEYDALVSDGPGAGGWQVLANPGNEYLVYFWGASSTTVAALQLPAGDYSYAWYDPQDATLLASGTVAGSLATSVAAPPASWNATVGVVLLVQAAAGTSTQAPYGGSAWPIPGTIQAEDFDDGGEDVAYHDLESTNHGGGYRLSEGVDIQPTGDAGGGYDGGWTAAGEWIEYTVNVASLGHYTLEVRAASDGEGGVFHLALDGVDTTGSISVPDTGGWQSWTTLSRTGIQLDAGEQVLRLAFDSDGPVTGSVANFNKLTFTLECAAVCTSVCGGEADGCGGACALHDGTACASDSDACTSDACLAGVAPKPSCGCTSASGDVLGWLLCVLLAVGLRRRRSGARR
ncbi:MAG: carbohydrate-binding protein [Myxococcota bacterium]